MDGKISQYLTRETLSECFASLGSGFRTQQLLRVLDEQGVEAAVAELNEFELDHVVFGVAGNVLVRSL